MSRQDAVKILRETKLKQCRFMAYDPNTDSYCALGLLVMARDQIDKRLSIYSLYDLSDSQAMLIMYMNDTLGKTFAQIANAIEGMDYA